MAGQQRIRDAEFSVVRGHRPGDESPRYKGWYFTGRFNRVGDPMFIRKPVPYWRSFQGLRVIGIGVFGLLICGLGLANAILDGRRAIAGSGQSRASSAAAPFKAGTYDAAIAEAVMRGMPLTPYEHRRALQLGLIRASYPMAPDPEAPERTDPKG